MNINVITQFAGADKLTYQWSREEQSINFFSEPTEACRCTVSFAATELKEHLEAILISTGITISDTPSADAFNIYLTAKSMSERGEAYTITPSDGAISITGDGRVGVLYGVYELLKLQGYRWIEPGKIGTLIPPKSEALTLPKEEKRYSTTCPVGRGFSIDGRLNENEELLLWMARNRLNVYFNFPNTCRYMHKLGFILRDGGHIFEAILDPYRITSSGKTMFEEHKNWYGLPEGGERTAATALRTQFCVSNSDLLEHLAEALLKKIENEWREAEEINVWGFDTWGGICSCEKCKKIGNASDQMLHMASYFRRFLDKKRNTGALSRDVRLVLCAYEGSATVIAPQKPIPENIVKAGDHVLFAPIVRCYEHAFGDHTCSYNAEYDKALADWNTVKGDLQISALEYYNVSKFEDLPLLFHDSMKKDFVHYYKRGVRGFSYMHIPMVNWGVRALTHLLYAELSWNVFADTDVLIRDYLLARYGRYAEEMSGIYRSISEASASITSWRAWKRKSVLSKLLAWQGDIPSEPLQLDDHFSDYKHFEKKGSRILSLWQEALDGVEDLIRKEKNNADIITNIADALNPTDLLRLSDPSSILTHLRDDKRGLIYGLDSYTLEYLLVKYHEALRTEAFDSAAEIWNAIELTEEKLESYYLPATYTVSLIAMISKDALTRTQLQDTVARCRKFRIKNGL